MSLKEADYPRLDLSIHPHEDAGVLDVIATRENGVVTFFIIGCWDSSAKPWLTSYLSQEESGPNPAPSAYILNFSPTTFINSSAFKEIIRAKKQGYPIVIASPSSKVTNSLSLSGIDQCFPILSYQEAVKLAEAIKNSPPL